MPGDIAKFAAATSLAAMVPTTATALAAHWRAGTVERGWLLRLAPGAVVGAWTGSRMLAGLDHRIVAGVFVVYAAGMATRMLRSARGARPASPWARWPAPVVAFGIGTIGVLAGLGGAFFTVPYLAGRGVRMSHAVATSCGVALALSAAAITSLSLASAAWIDWPAAGAVAFGAMLTAPLGARTARRIPTARLQQCFAVLLLVGCLGEASRLAGN